MSDPIWNRVDRRGPDECWPWLGGLGQNGQPTCPRGSVRRVCWRAGRSEPLPESHQVSMVCGTVICLNPAHMKLKPFRDIEGRFWLKLTKGAPDECWEWQGAKFRNGYGAFRMNGKIRHATHVAWELLVGPLPERNGTHNPDALVCMHSCDNPPCCNPAHLSWGKGIDNHRDMVAKGRAPWQTGAWHRTGEAGGGT